MLTKKCISLRNRKFKRSYRTGHFKILSSVYPYKEKKKSTLALLRPSNGLRQLDTPQCWVLPSTSEQTKPGTDLHVATVQSGLTLEDFLRLLLVQTTTNLSGCLLNLKNKSSLVLAPLKGHKWAGGGSIDEMLSTQAHGPDFTQTIARCGRVPWGHRGRRIPGPGQNAGCRFTENLSKELRCRVTEISETDLQLLT